MNPQPVSLPLKSVLPACTGESPMSSNYGLQAVVDNSGSITEEEIAQAEDILLAIRNEAF